MAKQTIGFIGAGRFGVTLALALNSPERKIKIFCLSEQLKELLSSRTSPQLLDYKIPKNIKITDNKDEAKDNEILFWVIPGSSLIESWNAWKAYIPVGTVIVNVSKTIETTKDNKLLLPSHIMKNKSNPFVQFVSAAFPKGILEESPTFGTAFSRDLKSARKIAKLFEMTAINASFSSDVDAGQISAALKNIYALGAGLSAGIGCDFMTQSAIATKGLEEIIKFSLIYGRKVSEKTFFDHPVLATDLYGTCLSDQSKNRLFGIELAKKDHRNRRKISLEKEVPEGIHTLEVVSLLLKKEFPKKMPIAYITFKIIIEGYKPDLIKSVLS